MTRLTRLTALILSAASLALPFAHAAPGDYDGPQEKLHVYLLIGQSNMAGRAKLDPGDDGHIKDCYLLDSDGHWVDSSHPYNRYSTIRKGMGMQRVNPGHSFSKTMLAEQPGISVGLVVNAKGGTRIEQWEKGTRFYNEAVRRAKQAQQTGTLKGILWHQGESNHNKADGYLEKLTQLVKNLRNDLDSPDLPFVAGQVNDVPAINRQIADLPDEVDHTGFVSSEGLTTSDRWHFDAKGMNLLGQRYAAAMLKLMDTR